MTVNQRDETYNLLLLVFSLRRCIMFCGEKHIFKEYREVFYEKDD